MKKLIFLLVILVTISSCNSDDIINPTTQNPIDVYVAGQKNGQACYWKNNQLFMLDSGNLVDVIATKIIVSNGNVYVFGSGLYSSQPTIYHSLFWKNGVLTNLTTSLSLTPNDYSLITDIDIVGNDVFFVGYVFTTINNYKLVCWKNGLPTIIKSYNSNFFVENDKSKIKVLNNDVYITAPSDLNNPNYGVNGYYKNNVFTEVTNAQLIDFAINNNEIYVFGSYLLGNKIRNITTNTETIVGFANDASITNLCFDNNNMYYSNEKEIYKNGIFNYGLNILIPGEAIVDFKLLNNNLYTLEYHGDFTPTQNIKLNGVTVLEADLLTEDFYSLYIDQN
jgi:hypothetical protein